MLDQKPAPTLPIEILNKIFLLVKDQDEAETKGAQCLKIYLDFYAGHSTFYFAAHLQMIIR